MKRCFAKIGGRPATAGFTLVELLVTMTIIVIMVSIGVPMYGQFTQQSALSGASAELVASIHEVRSRAVAERRAMNVQRLDAGAVAGDWSNGWQMVRVADGAVLQEVNRQDRAGSVRVVEAGNNNEMVFSKEGRTTGDFSFSVCDAAVAGETGRTVSVTVLGRVSVANLVCL